VFPIPYVPVAFRFDNKSRGLFSGWVHRDIRYVFVDFFFAGAVTKQYPVHHGSLVMSTGMLFPYKPAPAKGVPTFESDNSVKDDSTRSTENLPSARTPPRFGNQDQARDTTTTSHAVHYCPSANPVAPADTADTPLPTFKQQSTSGMIEHEEEVLVHLPTATAVPIFDTSTANRHPPPPAHHQGSSSHFSSPALLPSSTRCIFLLVVVLAAAGAIGVLCAMGHCSGGGKNSNSDDSDRRSSGSGWSTEELVSLINNHSLWHDTLIRYPISDNKVGTPEQQALTWIVEVDDPRMSTQQVIQRYALATIWFQSTIPWAMEASGNWTVPDVHECEWQNVTCNDEYIITGLNLRKVNAHGKIPKDIALLSGLTTLIMNDNKLTGILPSELGLLTLLTELQLDQNQFSGSIPMEWQSLSLLTSVSLFYAGLSGPVDTVVRGWPRLQKLSLSDNDFTGTLPLLPTPGSRVDFEGYLHNTRLKGKLSYCNFNNPDIFAIVFLVADCDRVECPCCTACCPESLNGIPKYEYCAEQSRSERIVALIKSITYSTAPLVYPSSATVEATALTWLIDQDPLQLHVGNSTQLQQRYALAALYFSGTWANDNRWLSAANECDWVGITCTDEKSVSGVNITNATTGGPIPVDLALLSNLQLLSLYENQHTGTIPTELGSLEFLEVLEIHLNQLTGTIPTELGQLRALYDLSLFGNVLESTVPTELGNLSNLVHLALSDGTHTGTIPTQLGQLTNLRFLKFHNNDLRGSLDFMCGRNLTSLVADCDIVTCSCCTFCCVEGGFGGIPEYGEQERWCRDD
jgi:Leucine-rich repeat (LRR) protein